MTRPDRVDDSAYIDPPEPPDTDVHTGDSDCPVCEGECQHPECVGLTEAERIAESRISMEDGE